MDCIGYKEAVTMFLNSGTLREVTKSACDTVSFERRIARFFREYRESEGISEDDKDSLVLELTIEIIK